jgi:hypothetical protein
MDDVEKYLEEKIELVLGAHPIVIFSPYFAWIEMKGKIDKFIFAVMINYKQLNQELTLDELEGLRINLLLRCYRRLWIRGIFLRMQWFLQVGILYIIYRMIFG